MRRSALVSLISTFVLLFQLLFQGVSVGGTDSPVIATSAAETSAAATARHVAYVRRVPGTQRYNLFVKRWGGNPARVNPAGSKGAVGAIVGSKLVYQQYSHRRGSQYSDLYLYDIKTRTRKKMGGVSTPNWEYSPKMTSKFLMFVRQSRRDGMRRLMLVNRKTGRGRVLDKTGPGGYLQPGQISGPFAVWLRMAGGKPSRVHVLKITTRTRKVVPSDRWDWAPSVTSDGTVYFGRTGRSCGSNLSLKRWLWQGSQKTLKRYSRGIDTSNTYTYRTLQGKTRVLHERVHCSNLARSSDIYRYADGFPVKLTVVLDGNGDGRVTSSPSGISCGSDCSQFYEPVRGKKVTLRAFPAAGDDFTGWSGASCPGTGPCTVSINQAKTVTATFHQ